MISNEGGPLNIAEMIGHHAGDGREIDFEPFGVIHLPQFEPLHIGGLTLDLSPTKHVVFMLVAAILVFFTMYLAGRSLRRQSAGSKAPKGLSGAIEALVLFVRNDIVFAAMGPEKGRKFTPLILALFFFVLFGNLLGMLPWGAAFTSNLSATIGLAVVSFLVIEIAGFIKLGPKGYMGTIFPHIEGMHGASGAAVSAFMGPVELLGKFTKPLALALRLFGNIVAGHFVVLSFLSLIFLFGDKPGVNWGVGVGTTALVTAIMLLELIVSFVQAYVFALLSATFIGMMQEHH